MNTPTQAEATPPLRVLTTILQISRMQIVAIAALGTFTFGWVLTGRHFFLLSLICGLDWFLVNLLNRVVDLEEDRANGISGTEFVARHRRGVMALGFGTLALSLVAVAPILPEVTPVRVAYHLLGLAYNWPLLPGRRRLKTLYFFKNTSSTLGFLLTLFLYPLSGVLVGRYALSGDVSGWTIALAMLFFATFELSYEVLYDLRDIRGDTLAHVKTFPVVHGEAVARHIIDGLLAVSFASLIVGYAVGAVPWRLCVMASAPALQFVYYKRALKTRGHITSGDCLTLTWAGASMLLCFHLWVGLGLPGV